MGEINSPEYLSNTHLSEQKGSPSKQAFDISSEFVLSRYGIWLKKNWTDITFNFYYRGSYSSLLVDYLASQSRKFAFIDIGANQGLYSLIAAQSIFCDQALAFEPVLKTFSLLEENIRANQNAHKISALRFAVSDDNGEQVILKKMGHSGAATLRSTPLSVFRGTEIIYTAGPKLLKEIKPAQPEIVKIDVEGHEEVVLKSLTEAGYLDTAIAVYYEVNTRWSNANRLKKTLQKHGFRHFTQTTSGKHYDVLATRHAVDISR